MHTAQLVKLVLPSQLTIYHPICIAFPTQPYKPAHQQQIHLSQNVFFKASFAY